LDIYFFFYNFVLSSLTNFVKQFLKERRFEMEKRTMNWKPEQEKIIRAFAKAFGIVHIYNIGYKVFADVVRENEMRFTETIYSETYVNCEGTGLIGKELCDEYSDKSGRKYWYVFNLAPFSGEAYTVFETVKPRSVKVLKSTLYAYEMLLAVLNSSEEALKRFGKIEVDEENPWDAMRVRLWKFLHPINT